jgi:hypothetical protein
MRFPLIVLVLASTAGAPSTGRADADPVAALAWLAGC